MTTPPLIVGLIGMPVAHSLSPRMQQAAFDAYGIPARYVLWETPSSQLVRRVAALHARDALGANVTIPHKTAVLPLLDELAQSARLVGAVNTIVRVETPGGVRLAGHNTDVLGLRRALAELGVWQTSTYAPATHVQVGSRGHMLLLGAGGAARAVLAVARLQGAVVRIAARRREAAQALLDAPVDGAATAAVEALDLGDAARLAEALAQSDVLINATPVGMGDPAATPLPLELLALLPAPAVVFDLVYSPPETALVRAARSRGLRASGGLPMLLYQGAEAFTLWTGRTAPLTAMRAALASDV